MILTDAITMVTNFLAFDLDSFEGETITTQQSVDVINEAIRRVARKIVLVDNKITFGISAGVSDYSLTDTTLFVGLASKAVRILKPFYVVINGVTLLTPNGEPGLWTMEQLDRLATSWRSLSDSTPLRAVRVGGTQFLRLSPAPIAANVSGGQNYIAGQYAPAKLLTTDVGAEMPMHEDLHWSICFLAAYLHANPNASEAEGWQRLKNYKSEAYELIDIMAQESANSQLYAGTVEDLGLSDRVYF